MTLTLPAPVVQLVKVFPEMVLTGPLVVAPSISIHPAIAVAPVQVTFEKLLFCTVLVVPVTEEGLVVVRYMVTVPPAPPLLNPVTIELPLAVNEPVVGSATLLEINVTLPVVFTFRLVNVLLLIFCERVANELLIYTWAEEPATECVIPLISLPVMVNTHEDEPPWLITPLTAEELAPL